MVTLKSTLKNIKADFQRRLILEGVQRGFFNKVSVLIKPGMVHVVLYRLSRFVVHNKLGFLYRIFVVFEHLYCRSEISPLAKIGPGLVIDGIAVGIPSFAVIGDNCTFLGRNTLTLGAIEGVDLNKDRILIGNHCVFGPGARVMRPVNIADGAQIYPNAVVMLSEKKVGSRIDGIPARRRKVEAFESIINWNPLFGNGIEEVNA